MKLRRRILLGVVAFLLLAPVVMAAVLVCLQIRQDNLDQALISAMNRMDSPAVKRLLDQGANPNAQEEEAPAKSLWESLTRLFARFRHKPEPGSVSTALPLLFATFMLHRHERAAADDIAVALIQHGGTVSASQEREEPLLHLAANNGMTKTLRLLLSRGADVNQRDSVGFTALYHAIDSENATNVELLLAHGAEVNPRNVPMGTLYWAKTLRWRASERQDIIGALKQHGARMSMQESKALACQRGIR